MIVENATELARLVAESAKDVSHLTEDYITCWKVILLTEKEVEEIIRAVEARIDDAKQRDSERMRELEAAVADSSRSITIRKCAGLELEELKGKHYPVTDAEKATFNDALERLEQALCDESDIEKQLHEAFAAVSAAVKNARAATLGNQSYDRQREGMAVDKYQGKFARLAAK